MKLIKKPNRWSCLVTSAAMVFDCTVASLCKILGHDGGEILWPKEPEPMCRRGHHIEEIQYAAYYMGSLLVPFVAKFEYNPDADESKPFAQYDFTDKFNVMLKRWDGILLGHYTRGHPHAVAWNAREGKIYDPDGLVTTGKDFNVECFYARNVGVG